MANTPSSGRHQSFIGGFAWRVLVTLAAFLTILKPLIKLSDQIQKKSEILTNWRLLDAQLQELTLLVKEHKTYNDEIVNRFHILMETKIVIVQREPLESVDVKLSTKTFQQVNHELPCNTFFIPEEE